MNDIPLYVVFEDGEWYFLDEELWLDLVLRADDPEDES